MSTSFEPGKAQRAATEALFYGAGPILVEVRFPRMATSPDWHLCDDIKDLDGLIARLGSGAEIHLHSVWDLKNTKHPVVFGNQLALPIQHANGI